MDSVSNKVTIPALAGAVATIGWWGVSLAGITPPAEVVAASVVVVMAVLGYVVPHGSGGPPAN